MSIFIEKANPVWNLQAILDQAIPFLEKKKECYLAVENAWKEARRHAQGNEQAFFSRPAKKAANNYELSVSKILFEVRQLNQAIRSIIVLVSAEAKEFQCIYSVSVAAEKFFSEALNHETYPTSSKECMRNVLPRVREFGFMLIGVSGVASIASAAAASIFGCEPLSYYLSTFVTGLAAVTTGLVGEIMMDHSEIDGRYRLESSWKEFEQRLASGRE